MVLHISTRSLVVALVCVVALSTAIGFAIARVAVPEPAAAATGTTASVTQVRDPGLTTAVRTLGSKLDSLIKTVGGPPLFGTATLHNELEQICENTLGQGTYPDPCLQPPRDS